jgi:hypothetical protein
MSAEFDDFMREREAAYNAYIRGDAAALAAMLTPTGPGDVHADQRCRGRGRRRSDAGLGGYRGRLRC